MRSARNQLILLGFVCQGLSWDMYLVPLLGAAAWALCLTLPRKPVRFAPATEGLLLLAGCAAGFFMARAFGKSAHFFFGYGLMLVQMARLMRPLNAREKWVSYLIALCHISVGCTVLLDYRFIFILLASIVLMPRALMELQREVFMNGSVAGRVRLGVGSYAVIAAVTMLFFLAFPRGFLGAGFQTSRPGAEGTLADSVLDPSATGIAQSTRILLQVEGHNIGYLRCFTLSQMDGFRWLTDKRSFQHEIRPLPREQLRGLRHRRVQVKDAKFLGGLLPTDGVTVSVTGNFFRHSFRNNQNAVESPNMWNSANNLYEYWIDPHPEPEPLTPNIAHYLTRHPRQPHRVAAWIDWVLEDVEDPLEQARKLESHLRDSFSYVLGAPELNRIDPVDDFIFNQRQGHCERFATTLAVLLRMKGIPARTVIGYVPSSRNRFSGWYNVRFNDAHAWTEAWFEDIGWVQLDATPRATTPPKMTGWNVRDLLETFDFVWYSKVVALDGPGQKRLIADVAAGGRRFVQWMVAHALEWAAVLFCVLSIVMLRRSRAQWRKRPERRRAAIMARHHYGRMLRALERRGLHRGEQQTPLEFLDDLEEKQPAIAEDAAFVTRAFCATRYGEKTISELELARSKAALEKIEKWKK